MNDCTFCTITQGNIPSSSIYEDADTYAFLDINPANPGHTLLIPKVHIPTLYEMPDELLVHIAPITKMLAQRIRTGMEADGITIGMNNEAAAGQEVPHAHIHIIPRYDDDGLEHWKGGSYASEEEMSQTAERIRNAK